MRASGPPPRAHGPHHVRLWRVLRLGEAWPELGGDEAVNDTTDLDRLRAAMEEANPPDWRDEAIALAAEYKTTPLELLRRRVEANHETAALRHDLRHFSRLLQERVQKSDGVWLNVDDVGRLLGLSRKAVYTTVERNPTGPLAQASSRLGRRLRFSREAVDAILLRKGPGTARVRPRVPSLRKETGR